MAVRSPLPLTGLRIPAGHKMASVIAALSDESRADFLRELYGALEDAQAKDDHAPVQFVIDAWWVSGKFVQHPRFADAVEAASRSLTTDKRFNPAELSAFLTPA